MHEEKHAIENLSRKEDKSQHFFLIELNISIYFFFVTVRLKCTECTPSTLDPRDVI
jgi:hypothetical protein